MDRRVSTAAMAPRGAWGRLRTQLCIVRSRSPFLGRRGSCLAGELYWYIDLSAYVHDFLVSVKCQYQCQDIVISLVPARVDHLGHTRYSVQ